MTPSSDGPAWGLAPLRLAEERWVVDVDPMLSNPWGAMFGGAALGMAVDLATKISGSRVRWASTRFLRSPKQGDRVELELRTEVEGRRASHVTVIGRVAGEVAFEALVVVGDGDTTRTAVAGGWRAMPDVPTPGNSEVIPEASKFAGFALGRIERRIGLGPHPAMTKEPGPGRVATWMRLTDGTSSSPDGLAWLADCLVNAITQAIGRFDRAASLDNSIRYCGSATSDWVLADAHLEAASDGFAFGRVDLFAEDGELLATGSQTCLIRLDEVR